MVDLKKVIDVPTPEHTDTWWPIPHIRLIDRVAEALHSMNMKILESAHALTREGARYFGLLRVGNCKQAGKDFGYVIGLRNTHDRSFKASLAVGSHVFVCDNLSFSGEITIGRMHTRYIEDDLPKLTARAIGLLSQKWTVMEDRYNLYRQTEVNDMLAHDLMIRSLEIEACTTRQLPDVMSHWKEPKHPEFKDRTAWSLFNSFTEAFKGGSIVQAPRRTIGLHALFDNAVGFKLPENRIAEGTEDTTVVINQ